MRLPLKGIPAPVLYGEVPKYRSVNTMYTAVMCQELMKRVNASFWARAKRGADDLGNTWKPLAPSTHIYKPLSPIEKGDYKIEGKRVRGLLTPAQDLLWRRIFARTYNRLVKKGKGEVEAKKEAAERAWAVVKAQGAQTKLNLYEGRITDTNIRYGRLVAATKPGSVANNRYYPPKNQIISVGPRGRIRINFKLPYAKAVDAVRPIVPPDISQWILESHEIAVAEAKVVYERIKTATPDRKRSNNRKSTSRNKGRGNRNPPRR
jgi:hypothetical protein